MKKRILSLLLALALVSALLPVTGASAAGFTDVNEHAWYYEGVNYAVTNGLMNGVGNNRFDPNGNMTRAMLVTVLWRYTGSPAASVNPFRDVPSDTWYTGAICWAAANGIVSGVSSDEFNPNGNITREQMAAILYRYATRYHMNTSQRGSIYAFVDGSTVSSYAQEAFSWAIGAKLINGVSSELLMPQGNATRAQVATILMRFIEGTHAEGCEHEWQEATCFAPKTCLRCGETEGEKLSHSTDNGKCSNCGYQIFEDVAIVYTITQDYEMGGGCTICFFEDYTYRVVAGGSSIYVLDDETVPQIYSGETNVRVLSGGWWFSFDQYLVCDDYYDETDEKIYVNVGDFTDPTQAWYGRFLYGEWFMTGAYFIEENAYYTQSQLNMVGSLSFRADHSVDMTLGDMRANGLYWSFLFVDEDGDYCYYLYDGEGYADLYYIVGNNEVCLILGNQVVYYVK